MPEAGNPPGFFRTVADRLLRSTFPFGITNIPVYSNGVCVYTPAVQRLLQLSANLCDASNTNFFPSVFRPLFANDGSNNVFIVGYLQVTNVSGATDPQLASPHPVSDLALFNQPNTPICDSSGFVNAYGVPWIIGAKKGLPNLNQLSLVNAIQVTRKLEVTRTTVDVHNAMYATNQMYLIGISNMLGISWWNSYSNAYPRPVTVFASDIVSETLTNGSYRWTLTTNLTTGGSAPGAPVVINSWPGSRWTGTLPNVTPYAGSFINANWAFGFLSPMAYNFITAQFDPSGQWQPTTPPLPQLPQFGLLVTNFLQAVILDGTNVIDYVQLAGPVSVGGLNQALADPDYVMPNTIYYQWSTNGYQGGSPVPWGVINQLWISGHPYPISSMPPGGQWSEAPTPMGDTTPQAEAAFFNGFFVPNFQWQGQAYVNNQLSIQAPYTPSRTVYSSCLLQANDPLVHYLASDLNGGAGAVAVWQNGTYRNATWYHSDDPSSQPLPQTPQTPVKGRYQPWGASKQMAAAFGVDQGGYNLAFKDPLVWLPDYWSFPTNLMASLVELGQVHRGTPWQTFFLKSTNVLCDSMNVAGQGFQNVGTNTWVQWAADFDVNDATLMAPTSDWRLAGLLMSLLNTNDPAQLFSVNDPSVADWQNVLNGLVVYSNSAALVLPATPLQFDSYVVSSNSPQAVAIANAIVQMRINESDPFFHSIGDVLAASTLSTMSPYLNPGSLTGFGKQQWAFGISDAAYEAIPAQLLPLLRPDSIGAFTFTNGAGTLRFSGADGYVYRLQVSTNLTDWGNVSTNQPVQGAFSVPASPALESPGQFFRTVLLP